MATVYFSHCWGVFEGGGVRVAAHAGAYAAAREAGIVFGRVAGTSGGAIVAAMVAAGAAPEDISRVLHETDFANFQSDAIPGDSVFESSSLKTWALRNLCWGDVRAIGKIALNSGLHSSFPLQLWLEAHLERLVHSRRAQGSTGPVRFIELALPLHVVATDLTTGKPKVWSREATPEESVAFAVRCSCSIPFFYQPVQNQQSVLVDGGVVSNLPSFVYAGMLDSPEGRSVLSRVLAFRLIQDANQSTSISGLKDFTMRLQAAAIDSASHIQLTLQPNVYDIAIPTGSVKSTDFRDVKRREKEALHAAGVKAVRDFVVRERALVHANSTSSMYFGFDEMMLLLVQELLECDKVFFAVGKSTYWLDFVFPTILTVARRGVQLICITDVPTNVNERRRISLLERLGFEVQFLSSDCPSPFEGFAFDLGSDKASGIMSTMGRNVDSSKRFTDELVRFYTRDSDPAVIEMMSDRLGKLWTTKPKEAKSLPYRPRSDQDLFKLLRNIHHYASADFCLADVEIDDRVLVLQDAVKEFKIVQIKHHMQDLVNHGCNFFGVREVALLRGAGTIVTPPVLERLNAETLVLIDGNTRFFHCLASGVKSVRAVVVSRVDAKLPAQEPRPLSSLRLISSTRTLGGNYRKPNESLFRRIEQAVHPYEEDDDAGHEI